MLSILFASMIAQAAPFTSFNCEIIESGKTKSEQVVSFTNTNSGDPHEIVGFKAQTVTGFIAISNGLGVVNITSNNSEQVVSFFGDVLNGGPLGGNIYYPSEDTWVTVACSISKSEESLK